METKARGVVLMQTSLLFSCHVILMLTSPHLQEKDREVCIKTRSPPALPASEARTLTQHTTVKWTIRNEAVDSDTAVMSVYISEG